MSVKKGRSSTTNQETRIRSMERVKDAGSRSWIAEIVFSSIKGLLGEDLLSTKFSTQKVEAR
jgi:hypothetical protein